MTEPDGMKAKHFEAALDVGQCRLKAADELIEPAGKRLEAIKSQRAVVIPARPLRHPVSHGHRRVVSSTSELDRLLPRNSSSISVTSSLSKGIPATPIRSAKSSLSIGLDVQRCSVDRQEPDLAAESLRRFILNKQILRTSPDTTPLATSPLSPAAPVIEGLPNRAGRLSSMPLNEPSAEDSQTPPGSPRILSHRSAPNLFAHRQLSEAESAVKRSQPSSVLLCEGQTDIAPIDKALAKAELASALTKQVCCSVCGVHGFNFPECRKCGLHFCSRQCRIGEQGAGDGKR